MNTFPIFDIGYNYLDILMVVCAGVIAVIV